MEADKKSEYLNAVDSLPWQLKKEKLELLVPYFSYPDIEEVLSFTDDMRQIFLAIPPALLDGYVHAVVRHEGTMKYRMLTSEKDANPSRGPVVLHTDEAINFAKRNWEIKPTSDWTHWGRFLFLDRRDSARITTACATFALSAGEEWLKSIEGGLENPERYVVHSTISKTEGKEIAGGCCHDGYTYLVCMECLHCLIVRNNRATCLECGAQYIYPTPRKQIAWTGALPEFVSDFVKQQGLFSNNA